MLFRLAVADLWHERILTLCVVTALTAVLSPLLILLSLKYGLVETLRTRLINDPRNREIRPQSTQVFTQADLDALRQRPDVRYVMPQTRTISTMVRVSLPGSAKDQTDTEILPTGKGDPLLEENGTTAPGKGQCALSQSLHRLLSAKGSADQVIVTVSRQGKSGFESATTTLQVSGVVGERATSREAVFVPLEFVEQIESWLEGHPVAELGWEGSSGGVSPVVEEIIVPTTRPLTPAELAGLLINTGFSAHEEMSLKEVNQLIVPPAEAQAFYKFTTSTERHEDAADASTLARFRSSLPPVAGDIYGYCRPIHLELQQNGKPLRTALFQVLPEVVNKPKKRPEAQPPVTSAPPAAVAGEAKAPAMDPKGAPPSSIPPLPGGKAATPGDETVKRPIPVNVTPNGIVQPLPDPGAGGQTAAPAAPGGKPGAPPPAMPLIPLEPPTMAPPGAAADGVIKLDRSVKPLPPPPPAPPPPSKSSGKDSDKNDKKDSDKKPPATGKKRTSGFRAGLFSPAGGRYVMAARPAVVAQEPVAADQDDTRYLYLPQSWNIPAGTVLTAVCQTPSGPVTFPVTVKERKEDLPLLPQVTAGVLRVGMERPIEYLSEEGVFATTRRGWPNFRLVATDIDSVQGLVDHFHDLGMNVITKAERIRDVKELDKYTSQVFWLIAGVGLTGAVGALLASLFASVERKRRSLGVLRLLGLRRRSLVRLPFYQSCIIVSASVGLSIAAWWWVSQFIGRFTSGYLEAGEHLATLPRDHLLILWGGALVVAAFASFLAGLRVMRVDPSDAIRDE